MEYAHRMWGRVTGLVLILPAALFYAKGWVRGALRPRIPIYIGLVVFQV